MDDQEVAAQKDSIAGRGPASVWAASPVSVGVDDKIGGGRPVEEEPVVDRAPEVAEEPLESGEMWLPRIMHVETDLLDCIGDVWPGESKILQGTSQTPVGSRISNRMALSLGLLALNVNRGGTGLAGSHPSPLQDVKCILLLV